MGSLRRILAITLSTFKEAVKNRAFIGLMLGALALIFASLILSELVVFDQQKRVTQDFGLFFIAFAGVLIAVTMGVLLVYAEIKRKTIYALLSKPTHRHEFLVGKYMGMLALLFVVTLVLSGAWILVMVMRGVVLRFDYLLAVILLFAQLSLVGAVAIFFSTFSSPVLSGIFTFGIYVVGRQIPFIEKMLFARKSLFVSMPSLKPVGQFVTSVFPDLTLFDITRQILLEVEVPISYVASCLVYSLSYIFIFLVAAILIFRKKDFI